MDKKYYIIKINEIKGKLTNRHATELIKTFVRHNLSVL